MIFFLCHNSSGVRKGEKRGNGGERVYIINDTVSYQYCILSNFDVFVLL